MKPPAITIISGGQTGADRAALDFAIDHGIKHGGWCPRGRKAEDGPISNRYQLKETARQDYLQRTEMNVMDTDVTVVFTLAAELSGGSKRTMEFAQKHQKPCLHLWPGTDAVELLRKFLAQHRPSKLNIAGSRASKEPDVADFVRQVLKKVLG